MSPHPPHRFGAWSRRQLRSASAARGDKLQERIRTLRNDGQDTPSRRLAALKRVAPRCLDLKVNDPGGEVGDEEVEDPLEGLRLWREKNRHRMRIFPRTMLQFKVPRPGTKARSLSNLQSAAVILRRLQRARGVQAVRMHSQVQNRHTLPYHARFNCFDSCVETSA